MNKDIIIKSIKYLIIESGKTVEVKVYHLNLKNKKLHLFYLDIQKT